MKMPVLDEESSLEIEFEKPNKKSMFKERQRSSNQEYEF